MNALAVPRWTSIHFCLAFVDCSAWGASLPSRKNQMFTQLMHRKQPGSRQSAHFDGREHFWFFEYTNLLKGFPRQGFARARIKTRSGSISSDIRNCYKNNDYGNITFGGDQRRNSGVIAWIWEGGKSHTREQAKELGRNGSNIGRNKSAPWRWLKNTSNLRRLWASGLRHGPATKRKKLRPQCRRW